MSDDTPDTGHHDDTDVPAALARNTQDGAGDIPEGPGDLDHDGADGGEE